MFGLLYLTRLNIQNAVQLLKYQIRTTFILKRRWEPLFHKKGCTPKKLRAKHYVYDLVEDTLLKKKGNFEVLLTEYVEGVGEKGDIVSLKSRVVYNKLLLSGHAVFSHPGNVSKYDRSEEDSTDILHSSPYAQRTVNMLTRITLAVVMNKDVPWVLQPWHIRSSLRKVGFYCDENCIAMPKSPIEGPDPNKQNKQFNVTITVNGLEEAILKCRIHHWSTDPGERLPYVLNHWIEPAEPLFAKQETNIVVSK